MAKRFCDTEIFKKKWFRTLPVKYKALFIYLFTNCDLAGIWEVDFAQVAFFVDKSITEDKALHYLQKQIFVIENGKKWFLRDFIPFQYGDKLNEKSPVHKKIIEILSKNRVGENTLYDTLYNRVSDTVKEEDKEEDKEEEKVNTPPPQKNNGFDDPSKIEFTIEHCLTVALNDSRWVRANKANESELQEFNNLLEKRGVYNKNPMDYKHHFANWKLSGKKQSAIDDYSAPVMSVREKKAQAILNA